MTPEGSVKNKIRGILQLYNNTWTYMPVPSGFGKQALDYLICFRGKFLAIEAKAPGEWLTGPQRLCAIEICEAGGTVFVISGPEGLKALARWLNRHS
jgi:hypothetical protein